MGSQVTPLRLGRRELVGSNPTYSTKRLLSSVGLEPLTVNQVVPGSNPGGDAIASIA